MRMLIWCSCNPIWWILCPILVFLLLIAAGLSNKSFVEQLVAFAAKLKAAEK